jgi:hypothetical protein
LEPACSLQVDDKLEGLFIWFRARHLSWNVFFLQNRFYELARLCISIFDLRPETDQTSVDGELPPLIDGWEVLEGCGIGRSSTGESGALPRNEIR